MSQKEKACTQFEKYFTQTIQPTTTPLVRLRDYMKALYRVQLDIQRHAAKEFSDETTVYRTTPNDTKHQNVAVEVWRPACEACAQKIDFDEITVTLRSLIHVNVAAYAAAGYDRHSALVYGIRERNDYGNLETVRIGLRPYEKDEILRQIASGLRYLHGCHFYVGVLRPSDILVYGPESVKIGGLFAFRTRYFGGKLATTKQCEDSASKRHVKKVQHFWSAPEIVDWETSDFDLTKSAGASDVWSLGMIACTLEEHDPFSQDLYLDYDRGTKGSRPILYKEKSAVSFGVAAKCLKQIPDDRPRMNELCQDISGWSRINKRHLLLPPLDCAATDDELESNSERVEELSKFLSDKVEDFCFCRSRTDKNWVTASVFRLLVAKVGEESAVDERTMDTLLRHMTLHYQGMRQAEKYVTLKSTIVRAAMEDRPCSKDDEEVLKRLFDDAGYHLDPHKEKEILMPYVDANNFWKITIFQKSSQKAFAYDTANSGKKAAFAYVKPLRTYFEKFDNARQFDMSSFTMDASKKDFPMAKSAALSGWMVLYFVYCHITNIKPSQNEPEALYRLRVYLIALIMIGSDYWTTECPKFAMKEAIGDMTLRPQGAQKTAAAARRHILLAPDDDTEEARLDREMKLAQMMS